MPLQPTTAVGRAAESRPDLSCALRLPRVYLRGGAQDEDHHRRDPHRIGPQQRGWSRGPHTAGKRSAIWRGYLRPAEDRDGTAGPFLVRSARWYSAGPDVQAWADAMDRARLDCRLLVGRSGSRSSARTEGRCPVRALSAASRASSRLFRFGASHCGAAVDGGLPAWSRAPHRAGRIPAARAEGAACGVVVGRYVAGDGPLDRRGARVSRGQRMELGSSRARLVVSDLAPVACRDLGSRFLDGVGGHCVDLMTEALTSSCLHAWLYVR